jgi:hypothetical protein
MSSEVRTLFRAEGDESAKTNSVASYTLYSEDENGNARDVNISTLDAWLRGTTSVRGRITRKEVGTYMVEFVINLDPGIYHLDVSMNGRPIFRKGDLQLEVTANEPIRNRLNFEMEGEGLYGGRVGSKAEFSITVTDEYGAPAPVDLDGLKVIVRGGSTFPAQIRAEGTGRFKTSFVTPTPGKYDIELFYDNRPVLEKTTTVFANTTEPSRSVITDAPDRMRSKTEFTFTIISKDSSGNRITYGGDHWEAVASGPERISKLMIQDHNDGSYKVTTSLPLQGVYSFDIRLQGQAAANSPLKIRAD